VSKYEQTLATGGVTFVKNSIMPTGGSCCTGKFGTIPAAHDFRHPKTFVEMSVFLYEHMYSATSFGLS
jgi:hypothetical protein